MPQQSGWDHASTIRDETMPQLWHNTNNQGWDHASTIRGETMPQMWHNTTYYRWDYALTVTQYQTSGVRPCFNCDTIPNIRGETMPQLWHNTTYQRWDYASTVTQYQTPGVRPCLNYDTIPNIRDETMPQLWHNTKHQGWDHASNIASYHLPRPLLPQSHCAESTPEWGRIDNSSLFGWSLLVILAMTMTMTINSNSVLLVRVALVGQYVYPAVPSTNTFHSWLCALKTHSYLLCRTAYVLYSSHSYCIRGCSNCLLGHSYWQWDWGRPEDSVN